MANEAIAVEQEGGVTDFTVHNVPAISKGTCLFLSGAADFRGASGASTVDGRFAGIAASDKVASDGATELGCWTEGIMSMKIHSAAGVVTGDMVVLSGANLIASDPATPTNWLGKALETSGASGTIDVRLI